MSKLEITRDELKALTAKRDDRIFRYLYARGQWQEMKSAGWVDIRQEDLFRG